MKNKTYESKRGNVRYIDWGARQEKRDNDMYLNKYIKPLMHKCQLEQRMITCLSLPATEWIWEQNLARAFPNNFIQFYGVERDPVVHVQSQAISDRLMKSQKRTNYRTHLLPNNIDLSKAIQRRTGTQVDSMPGFDIIYADYMGTWNENTIVDVKNIFNKNSFLLNPFGLLIITLALSRGDKKFRETTIEVADRLPQKRRVGVDDDHLYIRKASDKYSEEVHPLVVGIAETIVKTAWNCGAMITPHPVHIYYSPGASQNVMSQPEASFCFSLY